MRVVLGEKPSQAGDIAKVIGATRRSDGCYLGDNLVVTYCIGHLLENAPPEHYDPDLKTWSLETLPIIPKTWKMVPKKSTAAQLKIVIGLIKKASEVVIATDDEREGELIAWEILEYCGYKGPAKRLLLSALNKASIEAAWNNLRPASEWIHRYHSALARARCDWLVGMNLSRLFTLLGQQAGYFGVLSLGRVQTPTLYIVVVLDRAIAAFVPVPYWDLFLTVEVDGGKFSAKWSPPAPVSDGEGRCIRRDAATLAESRALQAGQARVTQVEEETVIEKPPLPFSLSDLQQACSSKFGFGVKETDDIAQSLYEKHKATTYPRVSTGYLKENMHVEVPQYFEAIAKTDPSIATYMSGLDAAVKSRAWDDSKLNGESHHGIIPTLEAADISKMSEKEQKVYKLIRAQFLAQFLGDHVFEKTRNHLNAGGLMFVLAGKSVINPGWRTIMAGDTETDGPEGEDGSAEPGVREEAPCVTKGQELRIDSARLDQLKTRPPKHFTEGTLVSAMKAAAKHVDDPRLKKILRETTGLGEESTRSAIITTLKDRGYIVRKGNSIRATDAGFGIIDSAPTTITSPAMTAVWEQALHMVEEGKLSVDEFVNKQAQWVGAMIEKYSGTTMNLVIETGPACPLCSGETVKRRGGKGIFWACRRYPECKGTAPVEGEKARKPRKASSGKSRAATASQ